MSYSPASDFMLQVARGVVAGHKSVNKFGRNTDVDASAEDIWDGQDTWVPPTTARIHNIASTDAADASGGTGTRTIQIYGLTAWDATEVSEVVTMNGTSNVATSNAYVIIHRMKQLTAGSGGKNAGDITATAVTDGTVTAQISAGFAQTLMAIYGVPEGESLYVTKCYSSAIKSVTSLSVELTLLVNPEPDVQLASFLTKNTLGATTEGTNYVPHIFEPPMRVQGPAIIKVACLASTTNVDVSAGFDGIVIED